MPLDKDQIQDLEYTFEFIQERIGWSDPMKIPSLKYLVDQIIEETGCERDKAVEAINNWLSGIRRKYG